MVLQGFRDMAFFYSLCQWGLNDLTINETGSEDRTMIDCLYCSSYLFLLFLWNYLPEFLFRPLTHLRHAFAVYMSLLAHACPSSFLCLLFHPSSVSVFSLEGCWDNLNQTPDQSGSWKMNALFNLFIFILRKYCIHHNINKVNDC